MKHYEEGAEPRTAISFKPYCQTCTAAEVLLPSEMKLFEVTEQPRPVGLV